MTWIFIQRWKWDYRRLKGWPIRAEIVGCHVHFNYVHGVGVGTIYFRRFQKKKDWPKTTLWQEQLWFFIQKCPPICNWSWTLSWRRALKKLIYYLTLFLTSLYSVAVLGCFSEGAQQFLLVLSWARASYRMGKINM